MSFFKQVRTTRLLHTNDQIATEHSRFLGYLNQAFDHPEAVAVLSNYVHQEPQDFKRREMFAVADEAFDIAWDAAAVMYENSPEGDSTAHGHFLALMDNLPPYETYDYHALLNGEHRKPLVDRMIELVRRG